MQLCRRTFLSTGLAMAGGSAAVSSWTSAHAAAGSVINDVTLLNPVRVSRIVTPKSTDDVRKQINSWPGPISIGGGCYSMGGQTASEDSLHFDMRGFDRLIWLDPERKVVRVQTGMRWRDLQSEIDSHDLSVKIMQSYSNFTIGGALSVNAHGRYVGLGPLVNSIRSIQLVLPGGVLAEVSPAQDADLFYGVIGGYGGLGLVTEVELDLAPNVRMERHVERVPMSRYPEFFHNQVRDRSDAVLHNADFDPFFPDQAIATTWFETSKPATVHERLYRKGASDISDTLEIKALADLPGSHFLRRTVVDSLAIAKPQVVWRNHEASLDIAALGPITTRNSTFALQEYFLPVSQFAPFVPRLSQILSDHSVNALNISIRHSPADPGTVLAWAREEVFSFVLYYRQRTTPAARRHVEEWTQKLIEASLLLGGTYYLPYQLSATESQFSRAYPGASEYVRLKARVDPKNQFRNKLLEKYYRT